MRGQPSVWRRVWHLEAQRPPITWTGPLPIVCLHDWPPADFSAWEVARAARNEAAMDMLVERHAGVRPLPPRDDAAWAD